MADNNHYKRAEQVDFLDNDPFAELTRIMGHDPRAELRETRQEDDRFHLDLEKEMMGDLGFEEFDEAPPATAPGTAANWSTVADAPSLAPVGYENIATVESPPVVAGYEADAPAFDAALAAEDDPLAAIDFEQAFAESLDELAAEEAAEWAAPVSEADGKDWTAPPAEPQDYAETAAYADQMPAEEAARWDETPQAEAWNVAAEPARSVTDPVEDPHWGPAVSDEPEPATLDQPAAPERAMFDDYSAPEASTSPAEPEQPPAWDAPAWDRAADPVREAGWPAEPADGAEVLAYAEGDAPEAAEQPAAAAWSEPIGVDLGAFEDELAAEVAGIEAGGPGWDVEDEAVPAELAPQGFAPEAEPPSATDAIDEMPVFEEMPAFAATREVGEPDAIAHRAEAVPMSAVPEPLSLEDELTAMLAGSAPAVAAAPAMAAAATIHGSASVPLADEAWRPALNTFGRGNLRAVELSEASRHPAGEHEIAPAEAPHVDLPEPFAPVPSADAAAEAMVAEAVAESFDADLEAAFDSHFDAFGAESDETAGFADAAPFEADATEAAGGAGYAPDIETVEIPEAVIPVAEEFDVPDLQYEDHTPPRHYDELEAEFAPGFATDGGARGARAPASEAWDGTQQDWDPPAPDASLDRAGQASGEWAAYEQDPEAYRYDQDLDQAMSVALNDAQEVEAPPQRRRGLLVAAIVAGVAVIGGAGVFGMSLLGDGGGEPVLIRADVDPMKVRPEEPGGIVVPNQENEVYQRVGGTADDVAPRQEELVTTAEEPLDVAAATQPLLPPSIFGEEEELADAEPKAEDRLEAAAPVSAETSDDFVAVAPRRVRTMVVLPDGSLVPREDVAPVVEPEPVVEAAPMQGESQVAMLDSASGALGSTMDAAPALAPAEVAPADSSVPVAVQALTPPAPAIVEDDAPTVAIPATVNIVPSPPASREAPRTVAAAAANRPAAPAAATPAPAPAAVAPAGADSGWSMQIASQPSSDSAQATYQDLARRYGGILQGRAVNIVRANIEGRGVYYRVRIPSSTREEAVQLCTRYKAAGGSCFVSR